jgi:ribonuclease P/MRP protein subunit RPP40
VYEEDEAMSLLEWVNLLSLNSPRVRTKDNIDPHLSRYEVPDYGDGLCARNMVCVRWKGFMPPAFVRDVFLSVRQDAFKSKGKSNGTEDVNMDREGEAEEEAYFAMSAQGFGGKKSWSIMQFEGRETLTWQIES